MANQRYARHIAIVQLLHSKKWVSSTTLAIRFGVSPRTIHAHDNAPSEPVAAQSYRNDDARLRAVRGRNTRSARE